YSASVADRNVGTGKTVSVSGISITGGADAADYSLQNSSASTTANNTPATLPVLRAGLNRVYDGTSAATVTPSDDRVRSADVLTISEERRVGEGSVASGKTVSVSEMSITGGADAADYALENSSASTTANITPAPLTVSVSGVN